MPFGIGLPDRVAAKMGSDSLVPAVEIMKHCGPPDRLTALAGYQTHKERGSGGWQGIEKSNLSEG